MKGAHALWAIGVSTGLAAWVQASVIRLDMQLEPRQRGNTLEVKLPLVNHGDEPAHAVQMETVFGSEILRTSVTPMLPVNAPLTLTTRHAIGSAKPGTHPLLIRVFYADANHYPFTSNSAALIAIEQDDPLPVLAVMESATMNQRGTLRLRVKNTSNDPLELSVRLHLPRELSAARNVWTLSVGPGREESLKMGVSNFSALVGSTYPVWAVLQADSGPTMRSALAQSILRIEAQKVTWGRRPWLPILIGLLIVIMIYTNLRVWRRKKTMPPR